MHPLLKELHQDHVNLSRVLRLMENQLNFLREGESVDFHLLEEIVDYVQSYPDLIHHPREDVIFLTFVRRHGDDVPEIPQLLEEHRTLIAMTKEIDEAMDQWRQDLPVLRDHVEALFAEYLRLQWAHLNLEEQSVFRLLDSRLTAEDWVLIDLELPRGSDPLFEDSVRRRYDNIYRHVVDYAS